MKVRGAVAQVVNKRHVTTVAGYDPLWVLGSARRTEHGVSPVANDMLSRPAADRYQTRFERECASLDAHAEKKA